MANSMYGLIFAGDDMSELNDLVLNRSAASLPYGARYRFIDFPLSNMVNANIKNVGVLMTEKYSSLLDHLGSGEEWGLKRHHSGLRLLPPFSLGNAPLAARDGRIGALQSIRPYIMRRSQDYVVISAGHIAFNIDLKEVLSTHISSNNDITIVCSNKYNIHASHGLRLSEHAASFSDNLPYYSLGTFIMSNPFLFKMLEDCSANGIYRISDFIINNISSNIKVGIFQFPGYVATPYSIADYFHGNMDILDRSNAKDLFSLDRPIYTKERADVPAYFSDTASSKNSLIANGSYIEGSIENCILFRGVHIKKGATLKNCIIMQDTLICEDSSLENVIADKNVLVRSNVSLKGFYDSPIVLKKGEII